MTGFELLLRVVARPDPRALTAGDVVVAFPVGHGWGPDELNHPHWRIVRVVGMPAVLARSLTAPQAPRSFGERTCERDLTVDVGGLDSLTGGLLLADRSGAGPDVTVSITEFVGLVSLKPRPRVKSLIGRNRRVLG